MNNCVTCGCKEHAGHPCHKCGCQLYANAGLVAARALINISNTLMELIHYCFPEFEEKIVAGRLAEQQQQQQQKENENASTPTAG